VRSRAKVREESCTFAFDSEQSWRCPTGAQEGSQDI